MLAAEAPTVSARPRWSWPAVAAAAGLGVLFVVAATAGRQKDGEALALSGLLAVTLALRNWGPRRLAVAGAIAGLLLYADVLVWMLPAVISQLGAGDSAGSVALTGSLSALSLTAMIASVIGLARPDRTGGYGAVALAGTAALGIAVVVTAAAVAGASTTGAPGELRLRTANVAFSARVLAGRAGGTDVAIANHDLFWHTFTIARIGVDARVPVGGTRRVHIKAEPGTYRFVCRIPGHEGAGMSGTLILT